MKSSGCWIIPTILITAYPMTAAGRGCAGPKPFSYDDLVAGICSALGSHKAGAKE